MQGNNQQNMPTALVKSEQGGSNFRGAFSTAQVIHTQAVFSPPFFQSVTPMRTEERENHCAADVIR